MLGRFVNYISQQHLFDSSQEVLLAVSGGRDSVAMCDLVSRAGFRFAIAHCNFHLRPDDCDRDERFVAKLAEYYGVCFHVAQFQTREEAYRQHLSIEEVARKERYDFFNQLCRENGYACVATAHHQDDSIETFFINLIRGTGIAGLHGIKTISGQVVRPMLCFSRDEIDLYVAQHGLTYVDDYTNDSLDYRRNQIRHQLIPLFREISPSFNRTMAENIQRFSEVDQIYQDTICSLRDHLLQPIQGKNQGEKRWRLALAEIDALSPQRTLLFEALRPFGFTAIVVDEILHSLHGEVGRQFLSTDFRLVVERNFVEIAPLKESGEIEAAFSVSDLLSQGYIEFDGLHLNVEQRSLERTELLSISLPPQQLAVDADLLGPAIRLRHWHEGDRFHPYGLKGTQLLSDYFKDHKFTHADKKSVWLLCDSKDQIVWVIGHRSDDRYKVTEHTQKLLLWKQE